MTRLPEQPLVSVIMNCLDSETYLREAIDSVYAQTYANWEIIFWDNASSDNSPAIAQSYGDGRLRYFRGETTVPLGQARNLAIAQSRGDLIAFLDCDDIWLPAKLEKQVPLFLADGAVGLVYSDTLFFNENEERRLYARRTPYRGHRFAELLNSYLISLETAVVRRAALDSLDHAFDPAFNAVEEYDLFVRIGLNWKIDFVPEVLAKWRVHAGSWTWRAPDRFTEEKRVMLERLQTDPSVVARHADALADAWHAQALAEAQALWKRGESRAARRAMPLGSLRTTRAALVWVATFFPYRIIESIWNKASRSVVPNGGRPVAKTTEA
jgi:glycosyltransferase involved in cell wall biosynthesis